MYSMRRMNETILTTQKHKNRLIKVHLYSERVLKTHSYFFYDEVK